MDEQQQESKNETRLLLKDLALFGIFMLTVSICLYFSDQYKDHLKAVGDERYINVKEEISDYLGVSSENDVIVDPTRHHRDQDDHISPYHDEYRVTAVYDGKHYEVDLSFTDDTDASIDKVMLTKKEK